MESAGLCGAGRWWLVVVGAGRWWLMMVSDCCCVSCPQFAAWVDAVVFVFSLEDEISFQTVYNYYLRLCSYRNTAEVPMVLVGTQGECGQRGGARGSPCLELEAASRQLVGGPLG